MWANNKQQCPARGHHLNVTINSISGPKSFVSSVFAFAPFWYHMLFINNMDSNLSMLLNY